MPFCTPFEPDNFGWYEEGRATQTSLTWGKMSKLTQTPAPRNGKKMMRARSSSTKAKAQKRPIQSHIRTHSNKPNREVIGTQNSNLSVFFFICRGKEVSENGHSIKQGGSRRQ